MLQMNSEQREQMHKDIKKILHYSKDEDISDYYNFCENEGIFHGLNNFGISLESNLTFKKYMKEPFYISIVFYEELFNACDSYTFYKHC